MNVLQPDRYPTGCVFLTVNPAAVDINIHPRKEEVQFLNPKVVESLIQSGVKKALEEHLSLSLNRTVQFKEHDSSFQMARRITTFAPQQDAEHHHHPSLRYVNNFVTAHVPGAEKQLHAQEEQKTISQSVAALASHENIQKESHYQIIGQLKKT